MNKFGPNLDELIYTQLFSIWSFSRLFLKLKSRKNTLLLLRWVLFLAHSAFRNFIKPLLWPKQITCIKENDDFLSFVFKGFSVVPSFDKKICVYIRTLSFLWIRCDFFLSLLKVFLSFCTFTASVKNVPNLFLNFLS